MNVDNAGCYINSNRVIGSRQICLIDVSDTKLKLIGLEGINC